MLKLLPLSFLITFFSIFGLSWIIFEVDPKSAQWYILTLFVILIFLAIFCLFGLVLYFLRTKLYKRYSIRWYIYTSFKMSFFVALFASIITTLAILQQVTLINVILALAAVTLFGFWSYLGKKQ